MKIYDLYGAEPELGAIDASGNLKNVESLASQLGYALGAEFDWRQSDNWNGVYFLHESDRIGKVMVINNVAEDPDDLPYAPYGYPIIVSVEGHAEADNIREALCKFGLVHIRRRRRNYGRRSGIASSDASIIRGAMDIYGLRASQPTPNNAHTVAELLMAVLKVDFAGNEGAFGGQDDHYYDESEEYGEIRVMDNTRDETGYTPFEEYEEFPVITSFFEPRQPDSLRERLAALGFIFLRRSEYPVPSH